MTGTEVRQILVATDFSETSEAAVRVAHAYAKAFGARLHVFHVAWPDEHGLRSLFNRVVADLGTTVPVVAASHRGDAAEEIVRYARLHGIDLIVLGTHGRTGFSRVLMGSVVERVVRTAPCPVLAVPPAHAAVDNGRVLPPAVYCCAACHTPSRDLLCGPCRARLRGREVYAGRGADPVEGTSGPP